MSNMDLWNKVEKTNPKYTKQLTHGAKLTAIGAHYQVRCATEQFGAAGIGWGWTFSDPVYPPNGTAVVKCVLWHGNKEQTVEQFGQVKLGNDDDALKKAGTDGLTKCLSYLGFNADVFMNKFSDSKYVDEMKKEFAEAKPKMSDDGKLNWFKSEVDKFKDSKLLLDWEKKMSTKRTEMSSESQSKLDEHIKAKHSSLTNPSPSNLA